MRRRLSIIALLPALLLSLVVGVPTTSAATGGPKVVIIVGATHGATASYRAKADLAYAEARQYTSNVFKVYSPNATWAKVKATVKGASIVVYFGHGNGWPSPYTYDPAYKTKDGFGLNATAGAGDSNNTYYGEPYIATLDLAPHAVVILSNLCYASGNSEPGNAAPSQATARKRVDNFGAGFLKVADAVIADGHGSPNPYIRALFTTHATIEGIWRAAPNFHDHALSFPSTRTRGAVAWTDTDTATSGYYRSLVWRPGLTTDQVTGARYADTGVDPATLRVPGNAEVGGAGAALYDDGGAATASIPAGTRLRVVEGGGTVGDPAVPGVRVEGLDDASIAGWVDAAALIPRDGAPPAIWAIDTGGGAFSPNGDGRFDTAPISARFSETVDWRVRVLDAATVLDQWTGHGSDVSVSWDGLDAGAARPDGRYDVEIRALDAWQNGPTTETTHLAIDTTGPTLPGLTEDTDPVRWFSPNRDGNRDTTAWTATTDEPGSLVARVYDSADTRVRTMTIDHGTGQVAVTWDGKTDAGVVVPDGSYTLRVTPRDTTGTNGPTAARGVRVDTSLGFVTASKPLFYPADGDALAQTSALRFTLTQPASVIVRLYRLDASLAGIVAPETATAAGPASIPLTGRLADGTPIPSGAYRAVVTATTDAGSVAQSAIFRMQAFQVTPSDATPARGQRITVTALSAEPLGKPPRLYVLQPGKATWSVPMTKTGTSTYKATITLKTGGPAGTMTLRAYGYDTAGGRNRTDLAVPLH